VASVGATLGTSAACPRKRISDSEATSPMTAVAIGSIIAVAVPKANRRITTAAASPTASLLSVSAFETAWPRYPPAATVRPASLAGLVAPMIDSASSRVRSLGPSDSVAEM
jgi:hypothetical protein